MSTILIVRRIVLAVAAAVLLTAPASARADDTYAAIAFSPKTATTGSGSNADSQEKAEQAALADCDADDAKVIVWVKNGVCAVAVGNDNKCGFGFDTDPSTARKIAIAEYFKGTGKDTFEGTIFLTWSKPNGLQPPAINEAVPDPATLEYLVYLSEAREIIRLTNVERKKAGAPLLKTNRMLRALEFEYAKLMAQKDVLSHDLDGDLGDRFTNGGYKWTHRGECCVFDRADAAAVVQTLMDDMATRDRLLNPVFTEIGVGVGVNADGKLYYALGLGAPFTP